MLVMEVARRMPPLRLTVPMLLTVFPAALRAMSSLPQSRMPVPLRVNVPVPRLAT
jgi:hypothetical protein